MATNFQETRRNVRRTRIALGVTAISSLVMGGVSLAVHPELGVGYAFATMLAPAFLGLCETARQVYVEIRHQIRESKKIANILYDSVFPQLLSDK